MKTIHTLFIVTAALLPMASCADEAHYPTDIICRTWPADAMTDAQLDALSELSKVSIRVENARIETKEGTLILRCELVFLHQGKQKLALCSHGIRLRSARPGKFTLDGRAYDYTPTTGRISLSPDKELRIPVVLPVKQNTFRSIRYRFYVVSMNTDGADYDIAGGEQIVSQP